jgi:hypothetical protein
MRQKHGLLRLRDSHHGVRAVRSRILRVGLRNEPHPSTGDTKMVLSANDDFNTRELSIGELETATGGFGLGGIIGGIVGGVIGSLPPLPQVAHPHPHPHHPLPPLKDILNDISPIGGLFGIL